MGPSVGHVGTKVCGWAQLVVSIAPRIYVPGCIHDRQNGTAVTKVFFWVVTVLTHFLGFNILAQVIVGYDSTIFQVTLHTGHNNDPGAFNISGVRSFVEEQKKMLLADGGTFFCTSLTHPN